MNAQNFFEYLNRPSLLFQLNLQELRLLVEEYPYCQNLHYLMAKKAQLEGLPEFNKYLKRAAVYAPNRAHLYMKIQNVPKKKEDDSVRIEEGILAFGPIRKIPEEGTVSSQKDQIIDRTVEMEFMPVAETTPAEMVIEASPDPVTVPPQKEVTAPATTNLLRLSVLEQIINGGNPDNDPEEGDSISDDSGSIKEYHMREEEFEPDEKQRENKRIYNMEEDEEIILDIPDLFAEIEDTDVETTDVETTDTDKAAIEDLLGLKEHKAETANAEPLVIPPMEEPSAELTPDTPPIVSLVHDEENEADSKEAASALNQDQHNDVPVKKKKIKNMALPEKEEEPGKKLKSKKIEEPGKKLKSKKIEKPVKKAKKKKKDPVKKLKFKKVEKPVKKVKKKKVREDVRRSVEDQEDIASETLAELLARQGSYKAAITIYNRLAIINPDKAPVYKKLIKRLKKI